MDKFYVTKLFNFGWVLIIRIFILIGLILGIHCSSREADQIVIAQVEDLVVTSGEFQNRLNNILLHTKQDNAELHDALLQNLINEKVLIHEAKKRGYDQTEEFQFEGKRIEIDVILDEYRDEIAEKQVRVTEEDIKHAFSVNHEQVKARILRAPSKEKADLYYHQLMNGATFDELALEAFNDPRLSQNGGDMGYFSWEDTELPFVDAAQKLELGEISKPELTRNGWYIIKVEDRFLPPLSENDYHREYKKLKWKVTHRQKVRAIRDHTKALLNDLNLTFNDSVVEKVILGEHLSLSFNDEENLGSDLNEAKIIATIAGKPLALNEFFEKAKWTSIQQRQSVKDVSLMKRFIEGLAVRDLLLKKAYSKGIHTRKKIQWKVKNQLELYLINKIKKDIMDTVRVNEKEAVEYFKRNRDQFVFPKQVNVREILVDSEEAAHDLYNRIQAGEDFAKLASQYSLRKWAAQKGGELGYGIIVQYGILGENIFNMQVDEVSGPFKTDSFYSIIKVIGIQPIQPKSFEEAKYEIQNILLEEKKYDVLFKTIDKMKKNLNIEYNMNGLT